jgi:hypothetical protein
MYSRDGGLGSDGVDFGDELVGCGTQSVVRTQREQRMGRKPCCLSGQVPLDGMGGKVLSQALRRASRQRIHALSFKMAGE